MNEIQLLIESTERLRLELTKYEPGSRAFGDCYLRLTTLETLLIRALISERESKAA